LIMVFSFQFSRCIAPGSLLPLRAALCGLRWESFPVRSQVDKTNFAGQISN
jgi:hypothetical protein